MSPNKESIDIEQLACKICLREIPRSEAKISETNDYVVYYCGLECYKK